MDKRKALRILSQRSTIVGIVGVIGGVLAILEMPISTEQELKIIEGLLLLVSAVAIITKEEEPYYGVDRRANSRSDGAGRSNANVPIKSRKGES